MPGSEVWCLDLQQCCVSATYVLAHGSLFRHRVERTRVRTLHLSGVNFRAAAALSRALAGASVPLFARGARR